MYILFLQIGWINRFEKYQQAMGCNCLCLISYMPLASQLFLFHSTPGPWIQDSRGITVTLQLKATETERTYDLPFKAHERNSSWPGLIQVYVNPVNRGFNNRFLWWFKGVTSQEELQNHRWASLPASDPISDTHEFVVFLQTYGIYQSPVRFQYCTRWCPSSLAKLVYKYYITRVDERGLYRTSCWDYKPTFTSLTFTSLGGGTTL